MPVHTFRWGWVALAMLMRSDLLQVRGVDARLGTAHMVDVFPSDQRPSVNGEAEPMRRYIWRPGTAGTKTSVPRRIGRSSP